MTSTVLHPQSPFHARVGERFRAERELARWPLRELAPALGCSVNTIRAHEAGAVMLRLDLVVLAARIFDVPVGHLVTAITDREIAESFPRARSLT